jgi:hypothetical protein
MAVGITPDTQDESAYLTIAEYKNAPTSIDYDNLVVGGNAGAQDAELANVIMRASSYMDQHFNQNLSAQTYTETQRTRMTNEGYIALHPNNAPVIQLSDFQYGGTPLGLMTLPDCSQTWFENQQIIIPLSQLSTSYSSQGPLAFGGGVPRQQIYTKYTYVAGFVNTRIVTATAAQSTLTVKSGAGIIAGQILHIYDGATSEDVTVASTYTNGSTTVPLVAPLVSTHAAGVSIGNLPTTIKQACILVTTAFLKMRGDNSMTMQITTQPIGNVDGAQRFGGDIATALELIKLYRRVR